MSSTRNRNMPGDYCIEHQKYKQSESLIRFLKSQSILPAEINPVLSSKESALIKQSGKADKILSRPNIYMSDLKECDSVDSYISTNNLSEEVQDQAEIQIKYSGYIQKEKNNADKLNRLVPGLTSSRSFLMTMYRHKCNNNRLIHILCQKYY